MAHRRTHKNFDIFSNYDYFVPDFRGLVNITLWFIAGALFGSVISAILGFILGDIDNAMTYSMLVAYPVMFIPPMMYASIQSRNNSFFGEGRKLVSDHYDPLGAPFCVLLVMMATLAAAFLMDGVTSLMPEMPEWLEEVLNGMVEGDLLVDFICVSVFAPIFEEWLCRGEVLRGLLNFKHKNKEGETVYGIKPVWAIIISAAFFAIIHANPWQAVPAFGLGCLFGYVYYKTGSLKLTMLMHFTNNTFALVMSNIDKFQEVENWTEVMKPSLYVAVMVFCAAFIWYFIKKFDTIKVQSPQGNCDEVAA